MALTQPNPNDVILSEVEEPALSLPKGRIGRPVNNAGQSPSGGDAVLEIDIPGWRSLRLEHLVLDVNGTLAGEDLAFVKRHLEQCVRCQREVEWLRELHAACVAGEAMPGASATFRNLRRQLEKPSGGRDPIARPRGPSGRTRRWWPWAIATEFAVIIVMGSLLISGTEGPALYRTLGTNAMAPATGSLVVVFDPATTEAEVRRILRSAGARIVDGPTQANAYVLDVPAGFVVPDHRGVHAVTSTS